MLKDQSILVPLLTSMQINKLGKLSNHKWIRHSRFACMTIFTTIQTVQKIRKMFSCTNATFIWSDIILWNIKWTDRWIDRRTDLVMWAGPHTVFHWKSSLWQRNKPYVTVIYTVNNNVNKNISVCSKSLLTETGWRCHNVTEDPHPHATLTFLK